MKKCALYARVSTDLQLTKNGSLDTQVDRLSQYVEYTNSTGKGFEVVDVYREEGRSGKDTDRPELQRMLKHIKEGKIDIVICTKLDRITRSLLDFYELLALFQKYEVEFVSLDESIDTSSPMGKANIKMILVFAELEREQTSVRTKEKMQWRAEQGLWNGGQILGYDLIDGELVINEDEAKIVRLIFEKYPELGSVLAVANWLNENGYRTKSYGSRRGHKRGGAKFGNTTVAHKLKSRVYIGQIERNGQIYEGNQSAIVEREVWERANKLLASHAPKRRNFKKKRKYDFALLGLVRCGNCGSVMTSKYSTGRNGQHFYYQCTKNSHGGKEACSMPYVPARELDHIIETQLKELANFEDVIDEITQKANTLEDDHQINQTTELRKLQNDLGKIKGQIDRLVDLIVKSGDIHPSMSEKLKELEERKETVQKECYRLEAAVQARDMKVLNAQALVHTLKHFSQIIDGATDMEKKELMPTIIESVIYNPDEIKIALYDHFIEESYVNQASNGALESSAWLRR